MANPNRRKSGKSDEDPVDKSGAETDPSEETFDELEAEDTTDDEALVDESDTTDPDEPDPDEAAPDEPTKRRATKRSARPVPTPSRDSDKTGSKGTKSSADKKSASDKKPSADKKSASDKESGGGKKFVPTGSAESGSTSRRQRMANLQQQQKRADRGRRLGLIGLCVVLALAVLAWPTYKFVQTSIIQATPRNELGVPAAEAGCLPEESNPATGNQEHVPDGTVVPYPRLPPDSGPHYNEWTDFSEKFYTVEDRPPVEKLVHNLEHGYVVIWYADTMDEQQRLGLQALVNTYSENNPSDKVKAAPWSEANDGGAFPEGTQVLLTRWVADGNDPTNVAKQQAVRLACGQVSGEVLEQFKEKYPATDSPEPNGG